MGLFLCRKGASALPAGPLALPQLPHAWPCACSSKHAEGGGRRAEAHT